MYQFPIGVMLESFRLPTADALKKAASMGVQGIQMYCTNGEHAPENMTPDKRRELLDMVKSLGLRFSAICGDLGHGFGNAELNPALVEKSKRILDPEKVDFSDIGFASFIDIKNPQKAFIPCGFNTFLLDNNG